MTRPSDRSAHTEATLDPRRPLSTESASLGSGRFLALYEMGQQPLEQREPAQVLRTIHEAIVRHLQPDRAALLAVSADGSYRALFTHELDLSAPPERWPVSGTVIRQVLDGGLAVLASDVRGNPQLEDAESRSPGIWSRRAPGRGRGRPRPSRPDREGSGSRSGPRRCSPA